jgi:hypothetical protein
MERSNCAQSCLQDQRHWAEHHFGKSELGDKRRTRRLVEVAAAMAQNPHMSLPKQLPDWSDLIGAYRFLSNPGVDPQKILAPHHQLVRQEACGYPVVLCVQDDTQLDFTCRTGIEGLGLTGDGFGKGLLQHTALAVLPPKLSPSTVFGGGRLLGVLDLAFHAIKKVKKNEKRRERQSRWTKTDVWQEAAQRIGPWIAGGGSGESMLVHVGDRHADLFRFLRCVVDLGHQFVVRAMHDRNLDQEPEQKLWETLKTAPVLGEMTVTIGTQRDKGNRIKRRGREAQLSIRTAPVQIGPPVNDPRTAGCDRLDLWAIYLLEQNPPAGEEPVQWMLLSSLSAQSLSEATTLIGYYLCRWVIEEWHRCLKQGCRIQASQLDHAQDVCRLGAIMAVLATRLMQMRDLADAPDPPVAGKSVSTGRGLKDQVPWMYLLIIAQLAGVRPEQLTPKLMLLTIAKRGGYLARKHDRRPGWIVLWRGWTDIVQMAQGAELYQRYRANL